ncbi:hypothetical protein L2E82_50178 [Cichorium intybus]|nr:hypothetical protein L2E82_50178 [Cichorium intybus]
MRNFTDTIHGGNADELVFSSLILQTKNSLLKEERESATLAFPESFSQTHWQRSKTQNEKDHRRYQLKRISSIQELTDTIHGGNADELVFSSLVLQPRPSNVFQQRVL